jgi:hypothetical protein
MFDGHTDGVSSDLAHSTNLIINAVTKWGLGQKTKYISCSPDGISFELFKTDIKNDIVSYSNAAMDISAEISAFCRDFIESYVDTFFNAKSEQSSIITGEKFEKMFNDWIVENDKEVQYANLQNNIKKQIESFKKDIKSY